MTKREYWDLLSEPEKEFMRLLAKRFNVVLISCKETVHGKETGTESESN